MNYVELISSTFRNIRHGVAPTSPGTCMLFVVGHWIFFNGCADAPRKNKKTHPTLPILPYEENLIGDDTHQTLHRATAPIECDATKNQDPSQTLSTAQPPSAPKVLRLPPLSTAQPPSAAKVRRLPTLSTAPSSTAKTASHTPTHTRQAPKCLLSQNCLWGAHITRIP